MTMLAALLLAAPFAPAQEPPAAPALPPTGAEQERNAQILAAIGQVIRSYDAADRDVRTAAEAEAAGRAERLSTAESAVGTLLADMEALLALLPKPPS